MESTAAHGAEGIWTTRAQRAPEPVGAARVFAGVAIVSAVIAGGFAWFGAWLVLPFAGLELVAVAAALGYGRRVQQHYERIIVAPHGVTVEVVRGKRAQAYRFHRHWAQVSHEPAGEAGRGRLVIRAHGKEVELGRAMSDRQRAALARALHQQLSAR